MSSPSESRKGGLGLLLLVAAGIAFAIFAPIGLLTVPLAGLMLVSRMKNRALTTVLLTGVSLWWVVQVGEPPDQIVRAVAVMGTVVFVGMVFVTDWSLTHRALVAVGAAAGGATLALGILGTSWPEIRWWVASRIEFAAQFWLTQLSGGVGGEPLGNDAMARRAEDWFETVIPLMADYFPATVAIQMFVGLVLATALFCRFTPAAMVAVGRFRDFRFSEHWGWIAVIALGIVLVAQAATAKLLAANVLVVAGLLYTLRGAAVTWYGITLAGGPGFLTTGLIAFSVVFMLPVVLIGTILVGVVDAGLDLRRRWAAPQKRA
jgi:uncharacterized membrane protein YhaH (DUF805 family)